MLQLDAETKIIDLLTEVPGAAAVLARYEMHCMGCLGAGVETIADSCKMHSVEIAVLLHELRAVLQEDEAGKEE